jgi:hypothetical protein
MVLLQISVLSATNGTYIPINMIGLCNVRILSIQYHSTDAAGTVRVIGINTDKLKLATSQSSNILFINNAQTNFFGFDQSHMEYHFNGVDMDGRMYIQVVDQATLAAPANFTNLLLTLDIEKLKV